MADFISTGIGAINVGTDPNALFLKVFSGEVLSAFKVNSVADMLQTVRSITSGKSAQFPVTGWLQAGYHTPGKEIVGQQGVQNEKIITIDDLLTAPAFIGNIEEAKNHYDIRSHYSIECGRALARQFDNRVIRTFILAARAAANLTNPTVAAPAGAIMQQTLQGALAAHNLFIKLTYVTAAGETTPGVEQNISPVLINQVGTVISPASAPGVIGYNVYASATTNTEKLQNSYPIPIGVNWTEPVTGITTTGVVVPTTNTASGATGTFAGTQLSAAGVDTTAATLRTQILTALQTLDQNNVPSEDRFVLLKPAQYWLLHNDVTNGYIGNQFFGGAGGIASGNLPEIGGAKIIKSNNFPAAGVVNAVTGEQNTYSGDFTKTVAVVGQKGAVGTVKLMDLSTDMEYETRYQGTLMVAKMALGTGILRPEAAVEIKTP